MDGQGHTALVVTSIASPTRCLRRLAAGAAAAGSPFYCVGDVASPPGFALEGCQFLSLKAQGAMGYRYAAVAPERHYARKNIGYLLAMQKGAEIILETDDDNFPLPGFWEMPREAALHAAQGAGWYNVYEWFGADAWPRGFPLERIRARNADFGVISDQRCQPLVWQGLVAGEPDVDAIFRLTRPAGVDFVDRSPIFLGKGAWSPFNSQNTRWSAAAFPLLYLPATCSFRATDIVRGYVAMRCLWAMDSGVAFTAPTAVQERNAHDLMRDFRDEWLIYEGASRIASALEDLELDQGPDGCVDNLNRCYETLVDLAVVTPPEMDLLVAWCRDVTDTLGA